MAIADRTTSAPATAAVRQVAHDVSSLHASLLAKLHQRLGDEGGETFAAAAQELAEAFGSVAATAVGALAQRPVGVAEPHPDLHQPGQMRRRLEQLIETHRRYGHPFGLLVVDVDGPDTRNGRGGGQEAALAVVGAALHDSVRLVDETFRVEENGLCVLAPNQTTVGAMQMAERLLAMLDELEDAGGMRIGIAAGVVSCPEHGADADQLLARADEAMWRARAVGQPVGVGALEAALQDR
ncbi:MAG TPA: diguanylate cyclase [Solirubrobacterales bacterium]|nr:diguanylate cyclase [Solirubrobacterales bacterium]